MKWLVKWVGWPSEYNQWLGEEDLENAPTLMAKFERDHARKKALEQERGRKRRSRHNP